MALLLSDAVICGEIDNRMKNSVQGWVRLRGLERPLIIDLTGNCAEDLAGRCFRFQAVDSLPDAAHELVNLSHLAPCQIGPVGTITANGRIQFVDGTTDDMLGRRDADAAPAVPWKQCLHLEWFSQNGHLVIELLDANLECVDKLAFVTCEEDTDTLQEEDEPAEDHDEDDPYGLFPDDLTENLTLGISFEENDVDPFFDEELDELTCPSDDEVPLHALFDPPLRLYAPGSLSDDQLSESLQVLLARLARHGVALDMCEHYTPRQAYQLLLEKILPQESISTSASGSTYVQHYATHEFCQRCRAEFAFDESDKDMPPDN